MSTMPTPFMGATSERVASGRLRAARTILAVVGVVGALGLGGAGAYVLTSQGQPATEPTETVAATALAFASVDAMRAAHAPLEASRAADPQIARVIADAEHATLEASRLQSTARIPGASADDIVRGPADIGRETSTPGGRPASAVTPAEASIEAPATVTPTPAQVESTALASAAPAAPVAPEPAIAISTLNARARSFLTSLNAE